MRAASWIAFSFMYLAIFSFLLLITQQGNFPSITVNKIVEKLVSTVLASAIVGISVSLSAGILAERGLTGAGGSAAMASVKVGIYSAAVSFVVLWAVWIGDLLVNLMPIGMPVWMGILFIGPFLVPTIWSIVSEFMGHKS